MAVRLVVAVTDGDWFDHLRVKPELAELNFWSPSATNFRALEPGELFLFKLHAPRNFIVGGGVFAYANSLPCSLAWEAFGESNGANSLIGMRARIAKYRRAALNDRTDFAIGCRVLTQPFFLPEQRWIPMPDSWSSNIVSFKGYSTDDADGLMLWNAVQNGLEDAQSLGFADEQARYGEPMLVRPRLRQGAFAYLLRTAINAIAQFQARGRSQHWTPRIFVPSPKAGLTRRQTAFSFAETSTVCMTR